jgi:hypothetical protein
LSFLLYDIKDPGIAESTGISPEIAEGFDKFLELDQEVASSFPRFESQNSILLTKVILSPPPVGE